MGGFRSGVVWSVLRAALIWAGVGTSVAAAICFSVIDAFAVFVFADAGAAAVVFGVIEGLWLRFELPRTSNSREFIRFGIISGSGLGLLALPPALAQSEASSTSWAFPVVYTLAALVGGGVGGACSALS